MNDTTQNVLQTAGQNNASFWYPAVTDEEVSNPATLASNYRKSMALNRRLYFVGAVVGAVWLIDYIRFGARKRRKR